MSSLRGVNPPSAHSPPPPRAKLSRVEIAIGIATTLVLSACVFMGDVVHGPRDRIIFSHKQHVKVDGPAGKPAGGDARGMETCSSCHFKTPKDIRGEEPLLPSEASCLACHGDWKKNNECGRCHTAPSEPKTWAVPDAVASGVKFSHARHQERTERLESRACEYCHANDWNEPDDAGGVRLAAERMDQWHEECFKCHLMRTEWDRMNCGKCHERVSELSGPKPASRFNHGAGWIARHGDEVSSRPGGLEVCARCHDRGYCTECHDARDERRVRPEIVFPDRPDRWFIHRGDYVNRHFLEARADSSVCLRCHGTQFCLECHEQRGLTPITRASATGSDRVAPFGRGIVPYHRGTYAELIDPRSPFFHGRSARRDAALCATCHDQSRNTSCLDCHAVPGTTRAQKAIGGNPHPPGFASPISKSSRACRGCHVAGG